MTVVMIGKTLLYDRIAKGIGDFLILSDRAFREQDGQIQIERYLSGVRVACIAITAAVLPFIGLQNLWYAYIPLGFAASYTCVILLVCLPRHPEWLRGGYVTATLEASALSLAVAVTGGDQSAFFVLYYP